jgi:coenzyme F420-reducing hydrogenase alpha subunit
MDYKPFSLDDSLYSNFSITNTDTEKTEENFSTYGYLDTTAMKNVNVDTVKTNQVVPLKNMSDEYKSNIGTAEQNYMDLCGNIANLNNKRVTSSSVVQKYYDEKSDQGKKNKLIDIRNEDEQIMMVQQNYIYILGTISLAIVLVGSIVIAKN